MRKRKFYLFLLVLFSGFNLQAQANERSTTNTCENIGSANQLFWCLVYSSPEVRLKEKAIQVSEHGVSEAGQILNPELDVEAVDDEDIDGIKSEISLKQTFELGGKRSKRKLVARAGKKVAETAYLLELEQATQTMAVKTFRLRQILTELELVGENIETFKNIQKQYRRLGRLNPEQTVASSVFEIAEQESELKKEELLQEKELIIAEFRSRLGFKHKFEEKILPPIKKVWPRLEFHETQGASKRLLGDEESLARKKHELEKAKTWPDLAIGPRLERSEGRVNETTYGVSFSLPLPIFNINGGARARAKSELELAQLKKEMGSLRIDAYAEALLKTYQASSTAVSRASSRVNIQKRHRDLHRLLRRGVVNSALVIELHREVFEFYQRLHEQELKAIGSLWALYGLKGELLDKEL